CYSSRPQNRFERVGESLPRLTLDGQLLPPGRGQLVILGPPVVLRRSPLRSDPSTRFEPVESRVERPVVDAQDVFGDNLDALRDLVTVSRLDLEHLQNDQVEGPL